MSDAEMNVGTPEAASSSETLFGGENDYAAMYNMICAHSVAQIVRCAALFSFADHLAAGPATADAVARVEGLNVDATFRLMRACAAYGLMRYDKQRGFSATPLLATPAHDDSSLFVRYGHGRPWPLGLFPSCSGWDASASGWNCRAYSTGENMGVLQTLEIMRTL